MNEFVANTTTITEYFEADHDRLDGLFKSFQMLKNTDFSKARESFVAFKFGLQRHIVWEEEVLFPLFEEKVGAAFGPTYVMRSEHKEIASHLEAIHKKVQARDPKSDAEEQSLLLALGRHNDKEENILYPAIDRIVTEQERNQVFEKMRNIPEERYSECCQDA